MQLTVSEQASRSFMHALARWNIMRLHLYGAMATSDAHVLFNRLVSNMAE